MNRLLALVAGILTAAEARASAQEDALGAYFKEHFQESDGGVLRLRPSSRAHAERLLKEMGSYQRDMEELKKALKQAWDKIADEPEVNAQVKKFLKSDLGLHVIYETRLRAAAGGEDGWIDRALAAQLGGQAFDRDDEGKYVVRADAKEKMEALLGKADAGRKAIDRLAKAFGELAPKIKDEGIDGRLRKAMVSPAFASVIAHRIAREAPEAALEELVDVVVEKVKEAFTESEGKLTLGAAPPDEVEKVLDLCEEAGRRLEARRRALDRFAERIKEDSGPGSRLKSLLQHDAVRLALLEKAPEGAAPTKSLTDALESLLRTVFTEKDGRYVVQEPLVEQIDEGLKKFARQEEQYRQAAEAIARHADKIADDEPVKAVYRSPFGRGWLISTLKGR